MKKNKIFNGILSLAIVLLMIFTNTVQTFAQTNITSKPAWTKAPMNEKFVNKLKELKVQDAVVGSTSSDYTNSALPMPFKITKSQTTGTDIVKSTTYPSSYDLRTQNWLTAVRDQGQIGDCWAFAAIGSLESNLKKSESKDYDFSEIHMAVNHGFSLQPNDGGNAQMATAYLARWAGPVYEEDEPYPNPPYPQNAPQPSIMTPRKHVQDVIFLPDRTGPLDNDDIKWALMNYGAVDTNILMSSNYLNTQTNAYYNNVDTSINHGIDIVGWDDNYPKGNFLVQPPGDGAFIVRNSWGTSFGEQGYFYVSYYDVSVANDCTVFDDAEPTNNYNEIYQYDDLGMTGGIGASTHEIWFSNVFNASSSGSVGEDLAAVSFYTTKMNTNYEVYLETDYDSYGFTRIKNNEVASGSIYMPGYHTVNLSSLKGLTSGGKFAVAVRLYSSADNVDAPVESPISGYADNVTAAYGQSFLSTDGSSWEDADGISSNTNVCLKAFTKFENNVAVSGIALNKTSLELSPNQSETLTASISPLDASDKNVFWESSDSSVATVNQSGQVTAVSMGVAEITATSEDGSFKAACSVNVKGTIALQSVSPANRNDVPASSPLQFVFNTNIYSGSNISGIILYDENGSEVPIKTGVSSNTLSVSAVNPLDYNALYKIEIPVGAICDSAGNTTASPIEMYLHTENQYTDSVYFQDINLENAVRNILNKPAGNITSDDMKTLTSLYASYDNITSLEGLQYAVNLKTLYLSNNNISNLWPVSKMLDLNTLDLSQNKIKDMGYLKNLQSLSSLSMDNNYVEDLSPIKDLPALDTISFGNNNLTDITSVENMKALTSVNFNNNEIKNIPSLTGLDKLDNADFSYNYISDLTPLENITSLSNLYLEDNHITDISPLLVWAQNYSRVKSYTVNINLSDNYIDTSTGSAADQIFSELQSYPFYAYYYSENQGIIINKFEPDNGQHGVYVDSPVVLSFQNNITEGPGFSNIYIKKYDSNYNAIDVPADIYISGNELVIKPSSNMDYNTEYNVFIPQNAIIDTDNKELQYDYYIDFYTEQLMGDLDGDGEVNIMDIAKAASKYGVKSSDTSLWDPTLDFNKDGVIDIFDLVQISKYIR